MTSWAIPADRRNWATLEETSKMLLMSEASVRTRLNDGRLHGLRTMNRWRIPLTSIAMYQMEEARKEEELWS